MTGEATHYDVLGVEPSASKDDIRAAYQQRLEATRAGQAREQAAKRPNDAALKAARDDEARVRAAWQVLSDPYQRGRYDQSISLPASDGERSAEDDADDDHDDADEDEPTPRAAARASRRAQMDAQRPPITTGDGTVLEQADTSRRAVAAVLDIVTILIVWAPALAIALAAGFNDNTVATILYATFFGVVLIVFMLPIVMRGQSLGKRLTHTMLVDRATGHLPTPNRVLIHYMPTMIAVLILNPLGPGGAIGLMIGLSFLLTRDGTSLGDKLAKTVVVIARYRPLRVR